MISELDIIHMVYRRFGGVSTNISRQLCEYAGIKPTHAYELHGYKISTQTMILELKGVNFNDFHINAQQLKRLLEKLMQEGDRVLPKTLLSIKAKKFDIAFNFDAKEILCTNHYCSQQNEMNSSMEFQFVACKQDGKVRRGKAKELGKIYILRLFRNGMLQIPGVDDNFDMSEASTVVSQMIALYKKVFVSDQVSVITKAIAMANYVAPMNIPSNTRIDLCQVAKNAKKDPSKLEEKCSSVGLNCVSFQLAAKRVVLYAKFVVVKEKSPFVNYNPMSTSNRKHIKTITLQITQRGIITIQGADGNFTKTKELVTRFQSLAPLIFNDYLVQLD